MKSESLPRHHAAGQQRLTLTHSFVKVVSALFR